MTSKKRSLIGVAALLALASTQACGSSDDSGSTTPTAGASNTAGATSSAGAPGSVAGAAPVAGGASVAGAPAAAGGASVAGAGGAATAGAGGGTAAAGAGGAKATGGAGGAAGGGTAGGSSGGSGGGGSTATFAAVKTLITSKCATCHTSSSGLVNFQSGDLYTTLTTALPTSLQYCKGDKLVTANDANSLLIRVVTAATMCSNNGTMQNLARMPDNCSGNNCLSAAQIKTISDWVAAGAPMQ